MKDGEERKWQLCEVCGSLMWVAAICRPGTANVAHDIANHIHNPTEEHWKAVLLGMLPYLKRAGMNGVTRQANFDRGFHVYADATFTYNLCQ